ncbi:MAG TPA: hypothetical protein VLX29_06675, partial [Nitrospirota bacterium]|nr:hypothetical protein [Nitrospirota bacterium]
YPTIDLIFSDYVPTAIAEVINEACLISELNSEASATISKRRFSRTSSKYALFRFTIVQNSSFLRIQKQ